MAQLGGSETVSTSLQEWQKQMRGGMLEMIEARHWPSMPSKQQTGRCLDVWLRAPPRRGRRRWMDHGD